MRTVAAQAQPPEGGNGGSGGTQAIACVTDVYHVASDHLGSTRVMVGEDGELVEAYSYGAWGEVAASVQLGGGVGYTFTGQEEDAESGLMNYRARLYDPALGRFLGVDPAGEFPSAYLYAGNNPISMVDPTGETVVGALLLAAKIYAVASAAYSTYRGYQAGGPGGAAEAFIATGKGFVIGGAVGATGIGGIGSTSATRIASGTASGALSGGLGSAATGGNFWDGARGGAISGGLFSAAGEAALHADAATYGARMRGSALDPSDEALHTLADEEFGARVSEGGLAKLTTEEVPANYRLTDDGGLVRVNRDGSVGGMRDGITTYMGDGQSTVHIAPHAFEGHARLYLTVGHELIHVHHNYIGLRSEHRGNFVGRTEYAAYDWSVRAARSRGWTTAADAYASKMRAMGLYRGEHYHKDFHWSGW